MNNLFYEDEDGSILVDSDCIDGCSIRFETRKDVDEFITDLKILRDSLEQFKIKSP